MAAARQARHAGSRRRPRRRPENRPCAGAPGQTSPPSVRPAAERRAARSPAPAAPPRRAEARAHVRECDPAAATPRRRPRRPPPRPSRGRPVAARRRGRPGRCRRRAARRRFGRARHRHVRPPGDSYRPDRRLASCCPYRPICRPAVPPAPAVSPEASRGTARPRRIGPRSNRTPVECSGSFAQAKPAIGRRAES